MKETEAEKIIIFKISVRSINNNFFIGFSPVFLINFFSSVRVSGFKKPSIFITGLAFRFECFLPVSSVSGFGADVYNGDNRFLSELRGLHGQEAVTLCQISTGLGKKIKSWLAKAGELILFLFSFCEDGKKKNELKENNEDEE